MTTKAIKVDGEWIICSPDNPDNLETELMSYNLPVYKLDQ